MLTQEPTKEMLEEWKAVWVRYKDKLKPNRRSGEELLGYLQKKYVLTEIHEKRAADAVIANVTMNEPYGEKLPMGAVCQPKTFFLENVGEGKIFYRSEDKAAHIWGEEVTSIFVGIDMVTGFFMVEGSELLWDEICAFCGLDEKDLQNYAIVGEYIACLKRFHLLQDVVLE
ncbi:hypothetical protein CLNEO_29100 [Anaerotignum neopropionicum]|uniref:Uncharacterized protein n=1 Tax=Anaerotignum neopropionicum TaxID=36847 RepID=A0A136WB16_9FIRM|nr:hypothetical protein [Anaerotignum neopropionicum]KXL51705.1 hypothetical protein CLNEO_29100 [Anaerotignum neopropionicum]